VFGELPKTSTKIQKFLLRERAKSRWAINSRAI
jgi:hypothetical protein